jgi:hypothetical protein
MVSAPLLACCRGKEISLSRSQARAVPRPQRRHAPKKALNRWGTDRCFKQTDLSTTRFGAWESTEIEQFFFGRVDAEGRDAIEYFATFARPDANEPAFTHLLNYMSVQKLRTPKGLAQLAAMTGRCNSNAVLLAMQRLQNLYAGHGVSRARARQRGSDVSLA